MRPPLIQAICLLLIIISSLLIIGIGIKNPGLYSLEHDNQDSGYHGNIDAQKRINFNSSTDMIPDMQALLDYSGPIAVNIRMKDLTTGSSELREYYQKLGSFSNLVVKLDMTNSEITSFTKNQKLQADLFQECINTSESIEALNRLEIRYRDNNDPESLTSVVLQGNALKRKMQETRDRFFQVNEEIREESEKFGLDTTLEVQAREEIERYTREVADDQEKREERNTKTLSPVYGPQVFLISQPDEGIYRTRVHLNGFITVGVRYHEKIQILLDNRPFLYLWSDDIGQFDIRFEIEQIPAGTHRFIAEWEGIRSDSQPLTVNFVNSTLTLNITEKKNQPVIKTSGTLHANYPVRNAPVYLNVNNKTWNNTCTDDSGTFSSDMTLPQGTFIIDARFMDDSFPVQESHSLSYEVTSSGTSITSIRLAGTKQRDNSGLVAPAALILVLVCAGCGIIVWYQKRRRTGPDPGLKHKTKEEAHIHDAEISRIHTSDHGTNHADLREQFRERLHRQGLSCASLYVYQEFLARIARTSNGELSKTLTPREVANKVPDVSYKEIFASFILIFEGIRYGGYEDEKSRQEFEDLMNRTDMALKEDDDED